MSEAQHEVRGSEEDDRRRARQRIEKRRELQSHVVAYVVINAFLIGIWATTGAGYFWPGWVLGGWGVGLVLHVWDYTRRPISETDIDREVGRLR
jgi:hypothetical protein